MDSSNGTFRTLTQMLRMWDDAALAGLLVRRPDLAFPVPMGLSDIASCATTRHSVSRAVDSLNAFELEVARRASGFPDGFAPAELMAGFAGQAPPVRDSDVIGALRRLRALALVWGTDSQLRPVRALAAVVSPGALEASTPSDGPFPSPSPPDFQAAGRQPAALVDKVAAGSAFELVRRIDVLLEHCGVQPVRLRRDGVVASREIREVSRLLDVPAALATLHLQIAEAARLLGVAAVSGVEVLAPTIDSEAWQEQSLAAQWRTLALAWRDAIAASGPAWLKRQCLAAFGAAGEGRVLSAAEVRSWLLWQRPRHATVIDRKTAVAFQQASDIGLLGLGTVASFAPTLDVSSLEAHLPARTDAIVLQADLTAVAPGPLTATAARELTAVADIESRGGATVYRFSAATLHRGVARGWDCDSILAMLRKRSRTPVPQALVYLIGDLARRGSSPADAHSGSAGNASAQVETAPRGVPRMSDLDSTADTPLDGAAALEIVAALRTAEARPKSGNDALVRGAGQVARVPVDTLREAAETGEAVWFSSVDDRGRAAERVVKAASVDAGALRAVDVGSGEVVAIPVSRITAAHILRPTTQHVRSSSGN